MNFKCKTFNSEEIAMLLKIIYIYMRESTPRYRHSVHELKYNSSYLFLLVDVFGLFGKWSRKAYTSLFYAVLISSYDY